MGNYLNPCATSFQECLNSEIYLDKSQLIAFTNSLCGTKQKYLCISRPRRFGKTMAADMLAAYYGCGHSTGPLFQGLKIAREESFARHLNQYHVIKVDMQTFMTMTASTAEMLAELSEELIYELLQLYPDLQIRNTAHLSRVCAAVFARTSRQFVFLIDEWDCVMRRQHSEPEKREYLDFLRNLLKDQPYVALAYMTGILPIKKYGEHSTLNMFREYTMTFPRQTSTCFGFTQQEVQALCARYGMDFAQAHKWYDGYQLLDTTAGRLQLHSIYSPSSIVEAMQSRNYAPYWNQTETYDALRRYIVQNLDGLKEAVVHMLTGASVPVNIQQFENDMESCQTRDDVLTLLIHLGYLAYDESKKTVRLPNKEVEEVFVTSIEKMEDWSEVLHALQASQALLEAIWRQDAAAVAAGVERAHQELSILQYNNENALSCTIGLALYAAREYYTQIRELPAGQGFADIAFIPRPEYADKPALLVELKWNVSSEAAIAQIQNKHYPAALQAYQGRLLLVGINYSRETKTHTCRIVRS